MRKLVRAGVGVGLMVTVGSVVACCAVGPDGRPVRFAGQTNIVIWDSAQKIQHFIRDARFQSTGEQIGFIAPTPSVPELGEADPRAVNLLENLRPRGMGCAMPEEGAPRRRPNRRGSR